MDILIALLAVAFYCIALVGVVPGLANNQGIRIPRVFFTALIAILLHAYLLIDLIIHPHGQNLSIFNVASLISWIIAILTTLAILKIRVWFLLPTVYSFSILCLLAASFLPGSFITHLENQPQALIHISLALFSYSTLMIATLYTLQVTWLHRRLKIKKQWTPNPNIPPLMAIERQLFNIIAIGNTLLTITLISGLFSIHDLFEQGKLHKAVLSFLAWIVYSVLLWGHYRQGWRGKRVMWFSLTGATLLTLAYFGSRLVKEFIIGG